MSETWRVFAAAPLNDETRAVMHLAQNRLRSRGWPVRWVDPKLGHLTLRFYGDTDQAGIAQIRSTLAGIGARHDALTLRSRGLGAFPSANRARVLWLGLDGDVAGLRALAAEIDPPATPADGARGSKPFKPHITLARLRNGAEPPAGVAEAFAALDLPVATLPIERVLLYRSVLGPKGPTYTIIGDWPLRSPGIAADHESSIHEHT